MHPYPMKTIAVRILGSDREPVDIVITPEVTTQRILTELGLEDCTIYRQGEQHYIQPEETLYDKVQDGDRLYAFRHCTSGTCAI